MPEFKFAGQWHVQGGTDLMGSAMSCPVEEKTLRIKVTNVFVDAPLRFHMSYNYKFTLPSNIKSDVLQFANVKDNPVYFI